ncbi:MAG TPA: alpha/beta hydrolase-fold protein, partial [Prolixibacteraceae bacterium]|nr:alpha/beta hydrolase-fold protein [Prolixibacteraceae bacterium]
WDGTGAFTLNSAENGFLTSGTLPSTGKVYCQVLYKQNIDDAQENVAGNWYSNVDSVEITAQGSFKLTLAREIQPVVIAEQKFVKIIEIKSKCLSDFSGHTRTLKASVLLPSGYYDHPYQSFPICYRVPGLNGRYTFIDNKLKDKEFSEWWFSGKAPQIIYVFLDSRGPYGDTYQVDSENNGPCGKALTEELIPAIEKAVHYQAASRQRYLAGLSTGGWVALGLQIFYPDFFDGTWSYSPDPVDFEHFGLINIYQDETVFYNRYGYLQPGVRTIYGEPTRSMKDWIHGENLVSRSGNYLVSGGQFGAYNAVFGPKGKDGLPTLMFDPFTGKIDHAVAKHWEKYDLKKVLEKNWSTLGPKLQGKIWIWTGDMDDLYSNVATRFLKIYLDKTENPKSDAVVKFTPMAGHCEEFSDEDVIMMAGKKAAGN